MKRGKKILVIITVVVALLIVGYGVIMYKLSPEMLAWSLGLSPDAFSKVEATTSRSDVEGKKGYKILKSDAGEIISEETSFILMPNAFYKSCKEGTVETLNYTTDVYEDGVTYNKYVRVYLPYGYDSEDKSKKYNVVYYQHGNTGSPDVLLNYSQVKKQLDYLFSTGEVEPCIVVMTTYYLFDDLKVIGNDGPAGDGRWNSEIPANFYLEVTKDIIPLVETTYNTYLENPSEDAVKESRDHRAFTGYSRGAAATWYMFHYGLEYFKYFSPMSVPCMAFYGAESLPSVDKDNSEFIEQMGKEIADIDNAEALDFIESAIKENEDLDYFIYVCSGNSNDGSGLRTQIDYFINNSEFLSYGTADGNNIYYSVSEFSHNDFFVPFYYYNSLPIFFGK